MAEVASERWLPVVGYEDLYQVSDQGRIRSVDRVVVDQVMGRQRTRRIPGRLMKPYPVGKAWRGDTRKYLGIRLCRSGAVKPAQVHHVVAAAFLGPRPQDLMVLHENDDSHDNRAANLRYATGAENIADAFRNGSRTLQETCKRGHLNIPANRYPNGTCRLCHKGRSQAPL